MSISEIGENIESLQKYYKKMVPKSEYKWYSKDPLRDLFNDWSDHQKIVKNLIDYIDKK